MTIDTADVAQLDRQSQFHPFTAVSDLMHEGPTVMTSGEGVRVRDIDGRQYLDGMAGLWCVNLGYGRREIVDAITRQSERLSFFHTFNGMTTDVVAQCADALLARAPVPMARVFLLSQQPAPSQDQLAYCSLLTTNHKNIGLLLQRSDICSSAAERAIEASRYISGDYMAGSP